MNIPTIIVKATALATCIFWLIILAFEGFHINSSFLAILSLIPISISCSTTILLTIAPFFWFKNKETDNALVFKTYFPFYAIVCFGLCFYGSLVETDFICFFASAFFTTMQTWVWFGKEINNNEKQETL